MLGIGASLVAAALGDRLTAPVTPVTPATPPRAQGLVVSAMDFTTFSPPDDDAIFLGDGSGLTGESAVGPNSTRGFETSPEQVYLFTANGIDGANPEKAAVLDKFTLLQGHAPLRQGDRLYLMLEARLSGHGIFIADLEQDETQFAEGLQTGNGSRLSIDQDGLPRLVRSELSSGYGDFGPLPGTPPVPLDRYVTFEMVFDMGDSPASGRFRLWVDDHLSIDDTGSLMWNAADLAQHDNLTLDDTNRFNLIEIGITALNGYVTDAREMRVRRYEARVLYA